MSKPVVTEANGAAIAGGFFFVLTADYVVASEKASFALAEVKVGVSFPTGPLELARHVLSAAPLRKMMLSGDFFKASQGQEMGFVDEVISGDRDAVKQAALKAARRYAKLPPKTYARIKHDMRGEVIEKIKADIAANKDGCADGWFNDETVGAMEAMIAATQKK